MSLDTSKLVQLMKQAAVEAVNAHDPMALKIGEVISISPLKISLNQKITVPAAQLILTSAVLDRTVYMTVNHTTGSALDEVDLPHSHTYEGRKKYTVHLGLNVGEKVLLLRCDGGQKFIVLDRVEVPND